MSLLWIAPLLQATHCNGIAARCDGPFASSDYAYHAQMEPLNSVAAVSPKGDAVEIWCGMQSQTIAVTVAAQALGIPESKVKFNHHLLGGGCGRRGNRDADFVLDSVLLSKASGKPVKVMWTREDDIHSGRFRPLYVNRLRDVPDMHIKLVQTKNHPTGAGQMAVPLAPSAISNAVFALTGVRLHQQPMLAGRVKTALLAGEDRFT